MSKDKATAINKRSLQGKIESRRSVQLAAEGPRTSVEFAAFQIALIGDIMTGKVTPLIANAASRSCSNLLEIVKMEYKYGVRKQGSAGLVLGK